MLRLVPRRPRQRLAHALPNISSGNERRRDGGAFTALAWDASAAYYNPAGVAQLTGSVVSISASVYELNISRFKDQFVIGDYRRDLKLTQFSSFPSTFGFFRSVYRGRQDGRYRTTIGLTILVPDDTRIKGNHDLSDLVIAKQKLEQGSFLQEIRQQSFWFGASVAVALHPKVSLGISLYYHLQLQYIYETSSQVRSQDQFAFATREINATVGNLHAIIGVLVRPISGLRIGFSLRTPSLRTNGSGRLNVNHGSTTGNVENIREELYPSYKLPLRLTLGLAYHRPKRFSVSADVSWNDTVQPYRPYRLAGVDDSQQPAGTIKRRAVFNFSIGGELWIKPYLIAQLGVYSNFAATPPVDLQSPISEPHVDMWGVSMGWVWVRKNYSMAFAVNYAFGFGKYRSEAIDDQGGPNRPFRASLVTHQLFLIIGGKYEF